jgi:hypothetical protein
MARIRTIKPSIWGDAKFAGLSRDARLLAVGLISLADDAGRFIATPVAIGGSVFPHDGLPSATVRRWRDEIARTGLIQLYQVDGHDYGRFPNWKRHQKINRPSPSVLPAPADHEGDPGPAEPSHHTEDSVSDSVSVHGATHESLTTGRGERRKERKPPRPPRSAGGTRCTRHRRQRSGCADCVLPPLAPVPDWCGGCSPSRRVEDPDTGSDLGPCPRCHPSTVRAS